MNQAKDDLLITESPHESIISYVMDQEPNGSDGRNITITSTVPPAPTLHPYYESYDVMTGVRIAATLGSFFGLMALLMLYKSKSKTEKAMEDPDFTAAAIAEVLKVEEEEERQLQKALEETVHHQMNPRRVRRSLDTSACSSPHWNKNTPRFSSFAGYSGLMDPPIRPQFKLPLFTDDDTEEIGSVYDDIYYNDHLDVPRRPSNITCSSSGSSYLERRDSATTLGVPAIPAHKCKTNCQFTDVPELYDFYYPIDIRVTQPTPGGSPYGSNRVLYDRIVDIPNLKPKLAPLASISSCNSSLGTDIPDFEVQSFASDSVFEDDDEDTEREIDEFSTDSDVNSDDGACYGGRRIRLTVPVDIEHIPSSKTSSTLVGSQDKNISSSSSSEHNSVVNLDEKTSWVQETLF